MPMNESRQAIFLPAEWIAISRDPLCERDIQEEI